jgi:hypothetical protein
MKVIKRQQTKEKLSTSTPILDSGSNTKSLKREVKALDHRKGLNT